MRARGLVLIGLALAALLAAGCGKNGEDGVTADGSGTDREAEEEGRVVYREEKIELPEEFTRYYYPYVYETGGEIRVFGMRKADAGEGFSSFLYRLDKDNSLEDITPDCLKNEESEDICWYSDEGGTACILYKKAVGEGTWEYEVKRYDEEKGEIETLDLAIDGHKDILGVKGLSDGSILLFTSTDMGKPEGFLYPAGRREASAVLDLLGGYGILESGGNLIARRDMQSGYISYTLPEGERNGMLTPEEIFAEDIQSSVIAKKGEDYYILTNKGLLTGKNYGGIWQILIKYAAMTGYSSAAVEKAAGLAVGENQDFYVSRAGLYHYFPEENSADEQEKVLRVVAVRDNPMVEKAAARFEAAHPGVRVEYTSLSPYGGAWEKSLTAMDDAVKKCNTEMLAGEGADILVFDEGIPWERYMDKGLLADLGDILEPMLASGKLYEKAVEAFRGEGGVYAVPMYIIPIYAVADRELAPHVGSLGELADVAVQEPGREIFDPYYFSQKRDISFFHHLIYTYYGSELYGEDGKVTRERLTDYLRNAKAVYDGMESYDRVVYGYNFSMSNEEMYRLLERSRGLVMIQCDNFSEYAHAMSAAREGMEVVNTEMFETTGLLGINARTSCPEEAEEFVRFCLEPETLRGVYSRIFGGVPINREAGPTLIREQQELVRASMKSQGRERQYLDMSLEAYPVEMLSEEEIAAWLEDTSRCGRYIRERIYNTNDPVLIAIKELSADYFKGEEEAETTVENILSRIELMQNE